MFLLTILLVCLLTLPSKSTGRRDDPCSLRCFTSKLPHGGVYTKCNVSYPLQLNCSAGEFLGHLENASSLDLSHNNLRRVPSELFSFCKDLKVLNLAANNIAEIEPGSFNALQNLRHLNLSFNNLRKWTVDYKNEVKLLNDLDVTGNKEWLPSEHLIHLKKLNIVRGVEWNVHCKECSLVKSQLNRSLLNSISSCPTYEQYSSPAGWSWHEEIKYGQAFDFIKVGFWPTCFCFRDCFIHQLQLPLVQAQADITLGAMFCLYATGSVAILLNVAVISFIVLHRQLRNNLAIILICNIAVCDVLVGLFTVIYGRFNYPRVLVEFLHDELDGSFQISDGKKNLNFRNAMGTILTCAVSSQVCGGFILTFEKFLKIVYVMKPHMRIGKKCVLLFLICSWSFSATFAILPAFNVGNMTYISLTVATPLPSDQTTAKDGEIKLRMGAAASTQIFLIVVQLASVLFYIPIFVAAKRSGASLGIKREARVAKKIALLVLTNFIIFTIPVAFGVFQDDLWQNVFFDAFPKWQSLSLTSLRWVFFVLFALPVICLSINSILNPLIYALRHPKFKQHLRRNSISVERSLELHVFSR